MFRFHDNLQFIPLFVTIFLCIFKLIASRLVLVCQQRTRSAYKIKTRGKVKLEQLPCERFFQVFGIFARFSLTCLAGSKAR